MDGMNEWTSILIQIPLVGAFIWFTVLLMKEFRAQQETLQQRIMEHEDGLQESSQKFLPG